MSGERESIQGLAENARTVIEGITNALSVEYRKQLEQSVSEWLELGHPEDMADALMLTADLGGLDEGVIVQLRQVWVMLFDLFCDQGPEKMTDLILKTMINSAYTLIDLVQTLETYVIVDDHDEPVITYKYENTDGGETGA